MNAIRITTESVATLSQEPFTRSDLLVLSVIMQHANDHGKCNKSSSELVELTGKRAEVVANTINRLERAGLVRRVSKIGKPLELQFSHAAVA